jgi:hypothetical protein
VKMASPCPMKTTADATLCLMCCSSPFDHVEFEFNAMLDLSFIVFELMCLVCKFCETKFISQCCIPTFSIN